MIQDPSPDYQIATVLLTPTVLFECCPDLLLGISVLQAEEKIIWEQSVLIRTSAHRAKEFTDVISISCDYLWFLEMLAQAKWFFFIYFFNALGFVTVWKQFLKEGDSTGHGLYLIEYHAEQNFLSGQ